MSKSYVWMSFSKIVPVGEVGNIGAIVMSYHGELSENQVLKLAKDRNIIPDGTASIAAFPLSEEQALIYPIDSFMSREELHKRNDIVTDRSELVAICDDCQSQIDKPN